jgi:osmotically-inducible protein OsmY
MDMKTTNNYFRKLCATSFLLLMFAIVIGCASTRNQESTGEYFDDSYITTKVKAKILGDADLKVAEINVETFKGVVQLSGFVNSRSDINKAVNIAESVKGVVSVKNDMHVK